MLDNTFFQRLRDIQKEERKDGPLFEIEDTFYDNASDYIQDLLKIVDENPLSFEAYQLREAQRITTQIRERREVKIIGTALSNVQKSHDLFKGHEKGLELFNEMPYNIIPEEEELYKDIIKIILQNREDLMKKTFLNKHEKTKIEPKKEIIQETLKQEVATHSISSHDESTPEKIITQEEVTSQKELIEKDSLKEINKSSKPTPPKLDESQIAMMFGQVPNDVLLDENNEPIKQTKVKTDITTPFIPPKPPVNDTVSLQNRSKQESQKVIEEEVYLNKSDELLSSKNDSYLDEELVVFEKEITTDILDTDEKTYGPFEVKDIVLLPKSLVKILKHNDVINIIR